MPADATTPHATLQKYFINRSAASVAPVGAGAVARPLVDSSKLCDYAGVLYLHPYPPTKHSGTSFFRLKLPDGALGGNICPHHYESLRDVPGLEKGSDLTMWEEDVEVHEETFRGVVPGKPIRGKLPCRHGSSRDYRLTLLGPSSYSP